MHDKLETTRLAALHLHKVLIDALRADYEREHGRVENPAEMLRLVANDPWFAWLRPLTAPILACDEPDAELAAVRGELRRVLTEPEFEAQYLELFQRVPEVVLAHAQLQRQLA